MRIPQALLVVLAAVSALAQGVAEVSPAENAGGFPCEMK